MASSYDTPHAHRKDFDRQGTPAILTQSVYSIGVQCTGARCVHSCIRKRYRKNSFICMEERKKKKKQQKRLTESQRLRFQPQLVFGMASRGRIASLTYFTIVTTHKRTEKVRPNDIWTRKKTQYFRFKSTVGMRIVLRKMYYHVVVVAVTYRSASRRCITDMVLLVRNSSWLSVANSIKHMEISFPRYSRCLGPAWALYCTMHTLPTFPFDGISSSSEVVERFPLFSCCKNKKLSNLLFSSLVWFSCRFCFFLSRFFRFCCHGGIDEHHEHTTACPFRDFYCCCLVGRHRLTYKGNGQRYTRYGVLVPA